MRRQGELVKKAKTGKGIIPREGERPFTGGPVERFIFVDEKMFPETRLYQAAHLVKNLPNEVPDYMVEHVNPSDETYLFIGFQEGLTGLTVEVQVNGERRIVGSPTSFFIPRGVRHRYRAVCGEGVVVITLLRRKFAWSK